MDTATQEPYAAAWRGRRANGQTILWTLFLVLVLVLGLGLYQNGAILDAHPDILIVGLGLALMVWVVCAYRGYSFRCPRCGERFYSKANDRWLPPYCTHCGLPVLSVDPQAVSPLFKRD